MEEAEGFPNNILPEDQVQFPLTRNPKTSPTKGFNPAEVILGSQKHQSDLRIKFSGPNLRILSPNPVVTQLERSRDFTSQSREILVHSNTMSKMTQRIHHSDQSFQIQEIIQSNQSLCQHKEAVMAQTQREQTYMNMMRTQNEQEPMIVDTQQNHIRLQRVLQSETQQTIHSVPLSQEADHSQHIDMLCNALIRGQISFERTLEELRIVKQELAELTNKFETIPKCNCGGAKNFPAFQHPSLFENCRTSLSGELSRRAPLTEIIPESLPFKRIKPSLQEASPSFNQSATIHQEAPNNHTVDGPTQTKEMQSSPKEIRKQVLFAPLLEGPHESMKELQLKSTPGTPAKIVAVAQQQSQVELSSKSLSEPDVGSKNPSAIVETPAFGSRTLNVISLCDSDDEDLNKKDHTISNPANPIKPPEVEQQQEISDNKPPADVSEKPKAAFPASDTRGILNLNDIFAAFSGSSLAVNFSDLHASIITTTHRSRNINNN